MNTLKGIIIVGFTWFILICSCSLLINWPLKLILSKLNICNDWNYLYTGYLLYSIFVIKIMLSPLSLISDLTSSSKIDKYVNSVKNQSNTNKK